MTYKIVRVSLQDNSVNSMVKNQNEQTIDLAKVASTLWVKRRLFYKVWTWTFIFSCIWILPQPRYYTCEVKLAPEMSGEGIGNGFSNIASSFGFNLGSLTGQDAIYPELYPDLFESPEFIVGLYSIDVTTKDGDISTNYFNYIKSHQKKNPLTAPFYWLMSQVKSLFETEDTTPRATGKNDVNPFMMNRKDFNLMQRIIQNISCMVDKKTSVITINVRDQDPLVCATMADSVKTHLQRFIIRYRTSKTVEDLAHYQHLRDSAETEYIVAMQAYSRFSDTHRRNPLQSFQSELSKQENDLMLKQNSLGVIEAQLQATKMKLQEKTPAFTTLKSAIVPVKPTGPKRMLFVLGMLIFVTLGYSFWITRSLIFGKDK